MIDGLAMLVRQMPMAGVGEEKLLRMRLWRAEAAWLTQACDQALRRLSAC